MYSDSRRAKEATEVLLRVQQPVQSCANGHLSSRSPPNSFFWQTIGDGMDPAEPKPQLSGRRSHRWAQLSQLNPQAAGSDDAQDASYQQGVL